MIFISKSGHSFSALELLQDGPFGRTYRGVCRETGEAVRIKVRTGAIIPPKQIPASISPPIREIIPTTEGTVVVETFVEGTDLKTLRQKQSRPWPVHEVRRLVQDVCADLEKFHQAGWVHGDIKPSNIVKRKEALPALYTLIDLDTAAPIGRRVAPYSFVYAPPELLLHLKDLYGPSGDIFSLAIIVWELLTGESYLQADHPAVLLQMQMSRPMPAHKKIAPPVLQILQKAAAIPSFPVPPQRLSPDTLRRAFEACLEKRYASASHFAEDFGSAAG